MREYNPLPTSMKREDELIEVVDHEPEMDINALLRQVDEQGMESLTDEEYAFLALELGNDEQHGPGPDEDHYANLADYIDESELRTIGKKVVQWVDWDEDSREPWLKMEKRGIRLLGVSPNVDGGAGFDGASTAVHPLLGEACVQFNSRTIDSMWPAGGPVKTVVMGKRSEEVDEQAKRVEQFMNYQYTELMPGAFEQTDKSLIRIPLSGSVFFKAFKDPIDGITRRMVEPADFIVPYRADDLHTAPRYTERVKMTRNNVRKRQVAGIYLDVKLMQPNEDNEEDNRTVVTDEIEATEGREEQSYINEDDRHTLYEMVCEYDLLGFEDKGEDGKETGIALQYVMTVDRDSQQVLSIYRNWKENDPDKKRIVYHVHYKFMPGLGFYGYGLYHWIGGLSRAATGALRALLDSAQFENMQGGFRSKDVGLPNGDKPIGPGEWKEVDCDAQDLKDGFFRLPYGSPSIVLFNLLGHLEQIGQRFVGTTDAMLGDGNQNTPVGTMLARIEQGGKVYTAVQKRLHESAREEFKLIAWLNSLFLPDSYPYAVEGDEQEVLRADFDDRVDVLPVSDPNMVSNVQRYFISQAVMELSATAPQLYSMRAVHKRALESLKVDNIDEILPSSQNEIKRMGPVEENAYAITGHPIKSFLEQDHAAHIAVHASFMSGLGKGQEMALQAMQAHLQEHVAHGYLLKMQEATGIQFAYPDGEEETEEEMPIEVENQIAMLSAQAAQQFMQEQQPDPELLEIQAEQERKDAVAQSDIARLDQKAMADIERKDAVTLSGMQRDNQKQIDDLMKRSGATKE